MSKSFEHFWDMTGYYDTDVFSKKDLEVFFNHGLDASEHERAVERADLLMQISKRIKSEDQARREAIEECVKRFELGFERHDVVQDIINDCRALTEKT